MKRMEAWVNKKNRIMEGLLSSSIRMLESARAEDWKLIEDRLSDRDLLLEELKKCDEALEGNPSRYDSVWAIELLHIQKIDEEVQILIHQSQTSTEKELTKLQREKKDLIQSSQIDPRGSRIEIEG